MTIFISKINRSRHKKLIIISIIVTQTLFFSSCYTTKEFIVEGSRLKDTENYNDIKNVTLKDSTKIKFGENELRNDAKYISHYKNLNDIILFTLKNDTIINEQIRTVTKYDFVDLKNILKAKVSKEKFNIWLTIAASSVAVIIVILFIKAFEGLSKLSDMSW